MNWIYLSKIFFAGWLFLVYAVVVNFLVMNIGLTSWWTFISDPVKTNRIVDYFYLFVIYPLLLGFGVFFTAKFIL